MATTTGSGALAGARPARRVLAVDDNEAGRYAVARVLRQAGYDVCEAASGAQALACLDQHPDLVVLDVHLPDMTGFEVAQRIKRDPATNRIPIIHVSATAVAMADQVHGLDSAEAYLVAPVVPEHLLALVAALLRFRDFEREAEARYQAIGDALPYGVWVTGANGDVEHLSDSFLDLIGMTLAQCKQFGWTSRLPPEAVERTLADWQRCREAGGAWDYEHRIRGVDGQYRTVLSRGVPIRNAAGTITHWAGINLDITERKRAEAGQQLLAHAGEVLSGSLDYQATLQTVAHLVLPELADFCSIYLLGADGQYQDVAWAHVDPAKEPIAREAGDLYLPKINALDNPIARAVANHRPLVVPERPPGWLEGLPPAVRPLALSLNSQSLMAVPLLARGTALGVIFAQYGDSGRRYSAADLPLFEDLARLAAYAVDNARLFESEQQARAAAEQAAARASHLQALTAALSEVLDTTQVVNITVQQAGDMLGAAGGLVYMLSDDGEWLETATAVGALESLPEGYERVALTANLPPANVTRLRRPLWIESNAAMAQQFPQWAAIRGGLGLQAAAVVPLEVQGRTIGAVSWSFSRPRSFSEDERAFLVALAQQCAQAVERARLYQAEVEARSELEERVARRTAELRREVVARRHAQKQLEQSREVERARIARELHDELGGALTGLKMDVSWLLRHQAGNPQLRAGLQALSAQVDETVRLVRRLATELRPALLDDFGLVAALEFQFGEFLKRSKLEGQFTSEVEEAPLASDTALACFRIFQEALTNVARHAQATHVDVRVAASDKDLVLRVSDDGRGMNLGAPPGTGHLGLAGMRERASLMMGSLAIESAPGQGTTVVLRVPLRPAGID